MKKQEKQQIIDDFKKVIEKLKLYEGGGYICVLLNNLANITYEYFMNSKGEAKEFTLKSNIPNCWHEYYAWWYMSPIKEEHKFTTQQVVDLKIEFLQLLIKELEE